MAVYTKSSVLVPKLMCYHQRTINFYHLQNCAYPSIISRCMHTSCSRLTPIPIGDKPVHDVIREGRPPEEQPLGRWKRFCDWLFEAPLWKRPLAQDQGGVPDKYWVSLGGDAHDPHTDWRLIHTMTFVSIFIGCWFVFLILYQPDYPKLEEWCRREAYLELARRERLGLVAISKHLIDPEIVKTHLPSDEMLGDTAIIV